MDGRVTEGIVPEELEPSTSQGQLHQAMSTEKLSEDALLADPGLSLE